MEGWLTDREAAFLYHAAHSCTVPGEIVEIGSFKGKSTVCLGLGSSAGRRMPDLGDRSPRDGATRPRTTTAPRPCRSSSRTSREPASRDLVTQIPEYSAAVGSRWNRPIALLWIDGDHSYAAALQDAALFAPWVVDGGVVAFHDATQGDLPRVVRKVFGDPQYSALGIVDSIVYATKSSAAKKSLRDVLVLAALSHYDRARTIARVLPLRSMFKRALRRLR